MPENQINVKIDMGKGSDAESIANAIKSMPGLKQTASQTFESQGQAQTYLKDMQAQMAKSGMQTGNMQIKQTGNDRFEASAEVTKKAYSPGGVVAGMATAVGAIGAGFKTLLDMSSIFKTFMGTTMKILGTAIDLMLAPLMPFIMKIMFWLIQTVFPLATKVGDWLGGLGDKTLAGGAVAGFVGLKFGGTLMSAAGTKIGAAFAEKFPGKTVGGLLVQGMKDAPKKIAEFGATVGGKITSAFKAADIKGFTSNVSKNIMGGFSAAATPIKDFTTNMGTNIMGMFKSGGVVKTFTDNVGKNIMGGFSAANTTVTQFVKDVPTKILAGFDAAKETITTFTSSVGKNIMKGFSAAHETVSTFTTNVGKNIMKGFSSAHETVSAFTTNVGKNIMKGFDAANETVKGFTSTVGKNIMGAFDSANQTVKSFASTVGSNISEGLKSGGTLIKSWASSVGTLISDNLKSGSQAIKSWGSSVGTLISDNLKSGGTAIKGWASSVGGLISEGLKATGTKVKGWASAVGGLIGNGIKMVSGQASRMGKGIGTGVGNALMSVGKFSKMGGLIGAGIGAAALGAAIGYAMWKKYKEHQEGQDITLGKSRLEQVRYLQSMGMSEDQALTMQKSFTEGDVSMDKEGIENYMKLTRNMADQVRMFGDVSVKELTSLQRGEQELFAKQLAGGMFGDAGQYAGIIDIIKKKQWQDGEILESVTTLLSTQIGTEGNIKTAQEELESRWYSGNIGGKHWNLLDPWGGLFGGGQASRARKEDEKRVREQLAGLGLGRLDDKGFMGGWKEDLTQSQAELGFWMTAMEGKAASSFLSPEAQKQWVSKKYADSAVQEMAETQINLIIDGGFNGMDWLTQDQRSAIAALVGRKLEGALAPSL